MLKIHRGCTPRNWRHICDSFKVSFITSLKSDQSIVIIMEAIGTDAISIEPIGIVCSPEIFSCFDSDETRIG